MGSRAAALAIAAMLCLACGERATASGDVGTGGGSAGGPTTSVGAGPNDGPCAPGERPLPDGTCEPAGEGAGVPPEACAEGFVPEDGGCTPILPAEPCPPGMMAVPGDRVCRAVADCGAPPWGDIPLDATTEHVDASYAGGNSDGSAAAPWTTIQQAVDAAGDGAVVAVASGTYTEDVAVSGKAVQLWGRCPSEVVVVGTGSSPATLQLSAAGGSTVRGLALTGPGLGLWVVDSTASAEQVWIHDGGYGVAVQGSQSAVTLRGVLIEGTTGVGAFAASGEMTIVDSHLRQIQTEADGTLGFCVVEEDDVDAGIRTKVSVAGSLVEQCVGAGILSAGSDLVVDATVVQGVTASTLAETAAVVGFRRIASGERASVTLTRSVLRDNVEHGVLAFGSDGVVEDSTIRDTTPNPILVPRGWGITFHEDEAAAVQADGLVRRSLVERAHHLGVYVVGSHATFDRTLVRDTQFGDGIDQGHGLAVDASIHGEGRAGVTILDSRFEGSGDLGILVAGAEALLEGVVIRDTALDPSGGGGRGINVQQDAMTGHRASATIRYSVIEDAQGLGMFVAGADVEVESTVVRDTAGEGPPGSGMHVQYSPLGEPSTIAVRGCSLVDNRTAGIGLIGATATVEDTTVSRTASDAEGGFGDGITCATHPGFPCSATIARARIESNVRAGIGVFGGAVELSDSVLWCNSFALDSEVNLDVEGSIVDLGGNHCGCDGVEEVCKVLTTGLAPPSAVGR